ncbi:MAG: DUF3293 domain-containing protein [Shewanella sp.]|nr:DUF3293 domain-containing protein [Shewanella sp.]MCF1431649.1 DUF3293 domain-containing protein [Shewanella sp.]MCF1438804.1 DUF3293 domain-containing protein [Shewanella sp.]MCF1457939.1 DUF3293 domain-containing protein [Shewanella sp.]
MTQFTSSLWQYYQQSVFLLTQQLSPQSSFAIVTACNPMGSNLSACQNRLNDRKLQAEIDQLKVPYRLVIGGSPDLVHLERSWALLCDRDTGVALGHRFNQLGIYFVENNQLHLLPCHANLESVELGEFSARVRLVSELPELEF